MKSQQFCSVCKQWLEMEVVPTSDGGEDDGVIWFRCPQCQGFLPKLSGADQDADAAEAPADAADAGPEAGPGTPQASPAPSTAADDDSMPWDSPADMMAEQKAAAERQDSSPFLPEDEDVEAPNAATIDPASVASEPGDKEGQSPGAESPEPIAEFAAQLAAADVASAAPYRPWENYVIGQCVHHLAWDDCGVVVAKEDLPGGRKIIKCYFAEAGVVRLIEQEPR